MVVIRVLIEDGVELPRFGGDPSEYIWQSKSLPQTGYQNRYKITNEGRLMRKEATHREKTDSEKQAEAEDHGFNTWDEYEKAVRETDGFQENIKNDLPMMVRETVVDEEWWADHNMHGSFEFHRQIGYVTDDGSESDYYWSYEARFSRGELDEILFCGERMGPDPGEEELTPPEDVCFDN